MHGLCKDKQPLLYAVSQTEPLVSLITWPHTEPIEPILTAEQPSKRGRQPSSPSNPPTPSFPPAAPALQPLEPLEPSAPQPCIQKRAVKASGRCLHHGFGAKNTR